MTDLPRRPKVGDHIIVSGMILDSGCSFIFSTNSSNHGKAWRFADETPAPLAERKPRELTDAAIEAFVEALNAKYVRPTLRQGMGQQIPSTRETVEYILSRVAEAMRPGLLEDEK